MHKTASFRGMMVAVAAILVVVLWPTDALAHSVGLSRGEYALDGSEVHVELAFARREVGRIAPALDADHDDVLSPSEVPAASQIMRRALVDRIVVTADGKRCPGTLEDVRFIENHGLSFRATYRCVTAAPGVRVELAFVSGLSSGHRHIAHTSTQELVLTSSSHSFDLGLATSTAHPSSVGVGGFFVMGIEHILLGFDHLVFLLGLVLIGGTWRSLLRVITAFTAAHSITLGLAALGIWAPSPSIVEPMIALSIVYVGVENFFVKDAARRWRVTFLFGLVHGFGFAGALGEIQVPAAKVPGMLLSFNAGVEAGQLSVLAVVLPLLWVARTRTWLGPMEVKVISAGLVLVGLFWFVTRAFGIEW